MPSSPAEGARVLALTGGRAPEIADTAWVAPGATVIGSVRLGERASVWYGAVLRAEHARIELGAGSNLQDGVVVHVDADYDAVIGAGVSVGHNAVLHGCTLEDDVLVGMSATVLNGAVVGTGSLIAAGAVVLEGTVVPPGSLVAGVPGRVRRELTEEEREGIRRNAASYLALTEEHRGAVG
ncbi:gamma carbonic anhydrase family protein [Rathayibacter sp. AY1E8]|jgi:carbonic anhydrase/acetyltransferase-like protein (isoleucine patch superfamily)|uniref:gamma carbonic anhydrase family protein n=1 Tax=unclassified Rathayibacter TaxID=2609250 RepID=UPI000CE8F18A|nr:MULTISPECIES: gamma carbonic anhydrase family protein [unclassified Rathayibacter]PPF47992.1 gamma carbonic anhydrase family protein [Rathayibacter sp. AY1A1]PPF59579.1 gamma carbonic anhydrase family protein [Rathayibacter sp. AY1C2]PPG17585.1 gamma carbonic anhydrase family protein [Rathayibacter sp. AY1E8]PPG82858.1 gamma carbonic anhydrase family protein [Rathayibacter sp. AY1H2]PPH00694.1 gamma carbonic anhydrase family protein [Rathayibacter sp. AY1G9]